MFQFILRRLAVVIPTLIVVSMISFIIIQLPPGDYLTSYVATLRSSGADIDQAEIDALTKRYGLDQPMHRQYLKWMAGVLHGDFGRSFDQNRPVSEVIWGRLGLTLAISVSAMIFQWLVALPVGIFSAVNQYSVPDYTFTFFGFIGLAVPDFMIALILMWGAHSLFGLSIGGLFSPEYIDAPWSMARVIDLLKHMWIPMLILGMSGTAGLIRTMRATMLDELQKPYVTTARAKGLTERNLVLKYPVRVALNPFISTVGWSIPKLISGATVISVVLSLPTTGSMLLRSLMNQDMYLAGSFMLLLSVLTVFGTLLSDILLAMMDPRIRYER
jgi:peptide/nickel transport system permease protein